jgi:molybdopterin converting factor small subunit
MIVKYFAYYRKDAGCKEETLLLGPVTAIELIIKLCEIHGDALKKRLLTEDGARIHPDVIFLIDGRNIDFLSGEASVIQENAVVSLFPRIAGG